MQCNSFSNSNKKISKKISSLAYKCLFYIVYANLRAIIYFR